MDSPCLDFSIYKLLRFDFSRTGRRTYYSFWTYSMRELNGFEFFKPDRQTSKKKKKKLEEEKGETTFGVRRRIYEGNKF